MKHRILFAVAVAIVGLTSTIWDKGELTPFVFERPPGFTDMPVSDENPTTVEGAELGRFLFYDPILSRDSSISCASCHKQEFAFSDGGTAFSTGTDGLKTKRNTPALYNLAWYPAMFWDGRATSVENQVFFPVRDHAEMDLEWTTAEERINASSFYRPKFQFVFGKNKIDSVQIAFAIAQFERTLISFNSKIDQAVRGEYKLNAAEHRGYEVMNDQTMGDCLHCHPTDATLMGTTFNFSNNGIEQIEDAANYTDKGLGGITGQSNKIGWFKIPSLRNVAITAPYMHDGRFESLEEVVDFYSTGVHPSPNIDTKMTRVKAGGVHLSEDDKEAVIAFLHCLTDSTFITNPDFSNPFDD